MGTLTVIALIIAIVCTILVLIFITPDNKRESLNKFFKFLHDLFNFKWLLLEKLLKVLYIFATIFSVFGGFVTLFQKDFWGNSLFGMGLAIMILGPIVFRFLFEGMMMFVLVVKNVISINNKMGAAPKTAQPKEVEPKFVFCSQCGTRYDTNQGPCPKCGAKN